MGPALAPVFPPNNSAKSSHLNSISTPRVMLLTKGEKVWESQDLSFMSIQLRAFSYPPVLLSFQIFKFDFWIPHWFSMLFLALPTLFLWFSHFKDQLITCATWTTCPPLPYFWVKCLFSLFTNPLSTWMSPQSHPSKAICKPHILFFLPNIGQSQIPKERPAGGSFVVCMQLECSLALAQSLPRLHESSWRLLPQGSQAPSDPSWQTHRRLPLPCLRYAFFIPKQRQRGQRLHYWKRTLKFYDVYIFHIHLYLPWVQIQVLSFTNWVTLGRQSA